ncbi:hypothetical protein H920_05790 [Fukomys damarensis]|uniref:Uncharacterized protein n=1 Tax=Fukomys damarensis TaxID=885580 RepID=A0A091DQN2_FUKDA|nr:hypothetical protein H920_05790 [Fukomys damarensis]
MSPAGEKNDPTPHPCPIHCSLVNDGAWCTLWKRKETLSFAIMDTRTGLCGCEERHLTSPTIEPYVSYRRERPNLPLTNTATLWAPWEKTEALIAAGVIGAFHTPQYRAAEVTAKRLT